MEKVKTFLRRESRFAYTETVSDSVYEETKPMATSVVKTTKTGWLWAYKGPNGYLIVSDRYLYGRGQFQMELFVAETLNSTPRWAEPNDIAEFSDKFLCPNGGVMSSEELEEFSDSLDRHGKPIML